MSKIKTTEKIVLDILERNIKARSDDFILYGSVLKNLGIDLKTTTLYDFLSTAQVNSIPPFATITKCRRTIQRKRQDLIVEKSAKARKEKESEYIDYNFGD